ncbi:tyrosine-type recombinase/integrase [Nocardia brevicatena]|uniref:tyrosine-type recombinase/integrase n=1 Tax=Nocardia brevicatena TaxID=37327 RepID=UPI0002FA32B6|nr:site-specific integrase [Nocardia brevicatena]
MASTHQPTAPAADTLAAARLLLTQLGLAPADLLTPTVSVPTFAEIVPVVRATLGPGTRRTYGTHLDRLEQCWGDRRLDQVSKPDLDELAHSIRSTARINRASRGGAGAVEHFVSTVRCVYRYAEQKGWIRPADNPARTLVRPTRRKSHRYAIPTHQLADICRIAATTGNDPELDSLILRLHIETACRRSGALGLRPHDLDTTQCLIYLREKDGTDRWQPVSPTLMTHLTAHARDRHSPQSEQLLRYRNGRPITHRRYDHLWNRIGEHLPWVLTQGVSTHWLRHTTLTWVERTFGYAIAKEYAGHSSKKAGTTATYVKANLHEVAAALAILTNEPHPLIHQEGKVRTKWTTSNLRSLP